MIFIDNFLVLQEIDKAINFSLKSDNWNHGVGYYGNVHCIDTLNTTSRSLHIYEIYNKAVNLQCHIYVDNVLHSVTLFC